MYTERYMKSLEDNAEGYKTTAVANATGLKNVRGGFLIQHGTGDDSVYSQNSALLVDTWTAAKVSPKKMHVQFFTDSDHPINFHQATTFVYKQMVPFLWTERTRNDTDIVVHQFDKKAV
jgi:dipeptidyl-peptidase-4